MRAVLLWLLLASTAWAQSPGTLNLQTTASGGPLITPLVLNSAVNTALTLKLDALNPVAGTSAAANTFLDLNAAVSGQKGIRLFSNGVQRWRLMETGAETGSNAGSDLFLQNYNDAGTQLGTVFTVTRSTGALQYNAVALFKFNSIDNTVNQAALVGWNHQIAGRNSRIGGTLQADNLGYVYTAVPQWVTGTPYVTGASVAVGYNIMLATSTGTSGAVTPTCTPLVLTCSDGAVAWAYDAAKGTAYQLVGGFASGTMNASFGGAAGGPQGVVFGFNTQANVNVANGLAVVGYENNFGAAFPVQYRVGEQIVAGLAGTNQGSIDDVGWRIGNQPAAVGGAAALRSLMEWGSRNSGILIDPNGYGLRTWGTGWGNKAAGPSFMVGAGAIDLTEFSATGSGPFGGGFIFRSNGAQILNGGDIQSNNALIHATATGASLDVSQYRVTGVAVHAGGGGTTWATAGWLADCTDGSIVKVTTVAAGVVTGVSLFYGAFGPAPVATVTCTSEQLVGPFDTAGNPLLPDTIQVDLTMALANAGAPVLTLGGTASVALQSSAGGKLGFYGTAPTAKPTGVAVTAAGVHAALVSLGLIAP